MGGGRDAFGGAEAGLHPARETTQSRLAALQAVGRHPECIGGAVDHAPGYSRLRLRFGHRLDADPQFVERCERGRRVGRRR